MAIEAKAISLTTPDRPSAWSGAVLLHLTRPEKKEKWFYFIAIGPALFDPVAVVRVWGRIGGHQRTLLSPCASTAEARNLAARLIRRRLRRGYRMVPDESGIDPARFGFSDLEKQEMSL